MVNFDESLDDLVADMEVFFFPFLFLVMMED